MHLVYHATEVPREAEMRYVLVMLLLFGCAKTPMQNITDSAQQQLNALEQSIKPECKSASTTEQINALRGTINSQLSTCESEMKRITADKIKWETIAIMLMIIIGVYVGRKFV